MQNNLQNSEYELPSEGELYNYKNNQNIDKQIFQNNDDNSNTNILNQQGAIPLNKFFQKPIINNYSNQNKNNDNISNKENSIQNLNSAAPVIEAIENKSSNSTQKKENNENNENKKFKLNIGNNIINDVKSLKSQISSNTQPNIINIKSKEKVNKCKEYSYLVLLYLSSITNNVLLYCIKSIINRIRGVN